MFINKRLYVGIDIALNDYQAVYIDIDSNIYSKKKNIYSNNNSGTEKLVDDIVNVAQKNNFNNIIIGFEATGNYGFHLPFFFDNSQKLKEINLQIFQINPKIIKNFRKVFTEIPKTDAKDAYLIAERLKIGKLPPYTNFDPQYYSLRTLTRTRFHMIMKLASEKSRFISNLFLKASAFVQDSPFSSTFGATSLALLTEIDSIEELINMDDSALINFIIKKSKNHFADPELIAKQVKYIARESYVIDRTMRNSITLSLLTSKNYINFLTKEIKDIDKQIMNTVKALGNQYKILTSIKGIGPVFSAGIIAEIGNIDNFSKHAQIAKYAGLIWRLKESGKYKSEETSLTKSGNKYLRYYLVQASQLLVHQNPDFIPYYQKKRKEAKKHQHKRAILFVARKLIRVIYSLLKKNQLYQTPLRSVNNEELEKAS
jgi:transposase